MKSISPYGLIAEARRILDQADHEQRDLSEFESGRVDALLDLAQLASSYRKPLSTDRKTKAA